MQVQTDDLRGSDSFIDQIANDLVAIGRDAHSLALPDEFADHSRGGESLAGAWRPLNGKDSRIQMGGKSDRSLERRFSFLANGLAAKSGGPLQQKIASGV